MSKLDELMYEIGEYQLWIKYEERMIDGDYLALLKEADNLAFKIVKRKKL